jgi:hypothetical protein
LPIQRRCDLQKSGLIPALSSSTRAHTLPKWDENLLILSSDKSGWTFLAKGQSTSEILFPVRNFVLPFLLTKNSHGLLVSLAESLGLEEDFVRCSDWADIGMVVVRYQYYRLAILPVLLNPKRYFHFL